MKRLTLGALALLLTLQLAGAATLTITNPWSTVRARPDAQAGAVAVVFGNDTLSVLERDGAWVAVRLPDGRRGWLPAAAGSAPAGNRPGRTQGGEPPEVAVARLIEAPPPPPAEPVHPLLRQARAAQSRGLVAEAREALVRLVLERPDPDIFYEAVRRLSYVHRVGEFRPLRGRPAPAWALERARTAVVPLLVAEGRARIAEGRYLAAAAVLEPAVLTNSVLGTAEAAEAALHDALTAYLGRDPRGTDPRERELAVSLFRLHFPARALPEAGTRVAGRGR